MRARASGPVKCSVSTAMTLLTCRSCVRAERIAATSSSHASRARSSQAASGYRRSSAVPTASASRMGWSTAGRLVVHVVRHPARGVDEQADAGDLLVLAQREQVVVLGGHRDEVAGAQLDL